MTRRCRAASRSSPRPSTGAIDTTTTRRHVTRTRQRLAIAGTAAALAAAVSLVGGVFRESGGSARAVPILHAAASEPLESGLANGNTTKLVAKLARDLRARPDDARSYTLLGLAYQQRARETGNPAYYTKSAGALHRARALDPADATTTSALGSLALAQHRFGQALALGRQAVEAAPYTSRNYGVLGDALVELGRYREAFSAFDRMSSLSTRPAASPSQAPGRRRSSGSSPGRTVASTPRSDTSAPRSRSSPATSMHSSRLRSSRRRRGTPHARSHSRDVRRKCCRFHSRSRRSATSSLITAAGKPHSGSTRSSASSSDCSSPTACAPSSRPRSSTSTTVST